MLSFVGYQISQAGGSSIGDFLMVIPPVIGIPWGVSMSKKEKRALTDEERAKADAEHARKVEVAQERLERLKANTTIISTAIVGGTTVSKQTASATSSIVRGAVGGTVFGPVGMIVGAATPKKKTVIKDAKVTFSILYASGARSVETVKVGSKRYYELAKYVVQ